MKIFNRGALLLLVSLLLAGLTACGEVNNMRRNSNLQETLMHYELLMNRSDFIAAARFRLPSAKWDTRGLDRFQVTHYEVKLTDPASDGESIKRDISFRFIDRHSMRERSSTYQEIWVYNANARQWQLEGSPPVFR